MRICNLIDIPEPSIKNCEMAGEPNGVVVGNNEAIQGANLTVLNCNIHGYAKDINCEGSNITLKVLISGMKALAELAPILRTSSATASDRISISATIRSSIPQDNTTTIFNATDFGSSSNVNHKWQSPLRRRRAIPCYVGAFEQCLGDKQRDGGHQGNYGYLTDGTPTTFTWANNTDLFTGRSFL